MINMARPQIGDDEKKAVLEVMDSGIIAQGPRTKAFEEAFASMCTTKHAIATSSGTTALHIAMLANKIGAGDEVITSAFTFIASANSVIYAGGRPVFVDIDPKTFNIDADLIEAAITPKTKAILPIHLFGLPCDMEKIMAIAKKHNLLVIEDACQSHGATFKGKKVGSFGTGTFSLYPTKNITSGEGGMITTNDDAVEEACRVIRNHGMRKRYYHDEIGYNFRMTDMHAAIGLAQIAKLEMFNQKRQENAAFYDKNLKGVVTPFVPEGCQHVYHQYTVRVPGGKRDALRAYLAEHEIGSEVYYPVPIHKQGFYQTDYGYHISLPETEKAASEVLSIPVHPGISAADREKVAATINEFMAKG
ncbi:DegT/DnrJ/EryC1/StrS family aminotransferase [Leptolinea tardivitalis]|uniref:Aminotransferase DegT n=1 Tax=Leptolinea tardivitalis TaxID=229920 RepID=A0A0P6X5N8_9CHLR|nr:DegT/DnrJ/EryC1/StrS family aminotransferase [Leptolinea tardivitalis]KPL70214.1 aminotransferase DegT [Leptolinea tardivitalis]GAP21750.1 predicted pyridoxal phosphate-dependent enzyme [Leptolinea tardivitalis]